MSIFSRLRRFRTIGLLMAASAILTSSVRAAATEPVPALLVRNWDQSDGLPSTVVQSVARTRDGYVWLGTANGVARFDGVRFLGFNEPFGQRTAISALFATNNTLWIGTLTGQLVRREGSVVSEMMLPAEAKGRSISGICSDAGGNLWIATRGAGLFRLNAEGKAMAKTNGLPTLDATQILSATSNQIWAVVGGKVMALQNGTWQTPPAIATLTQPVRTITASSDGGLWIATSQPRHDQGRVFKLAQGSLTEIGSYPWRKDSERSRVSALLEGADGQLWCGTEGDGVFLWSATGNWSRLATTPPLSQMEVNSLVADEAKIIWIGSRTAGLYQVRPKLVALLRMPQDSPNIFTTVCVTRDGSIWGGTDGLGLFRWQGSSLKNFGMAEGLDNLQITALLEDHKSNLWAATKNGVFALQAERFQAIQVKGVSATAAYALLEDHAGNLWVGNQKGLVCLRGQVPKIYGSRQGLSIRPRALAEDPNGIIYTGGFGSGLFRLGNGRIENYPANRWLGSDHIRALHFDAAGDLWIATEAYGLTRMHDSNLRTWNYQDDGLPSSHGFAILETNDVLWVSSEHGIYGAPKQVLEKYQRGGPPLRSMIWWLTTDDGLAQKFCSGVGQPAAAIAPDGTFWFPNGIALAGFHPDKVAIYRHVYPPLIEEPIVDGMRWLPDENGRFRISSDSRRFEFPFTSPNVVAPNQLRYRFKMEGMDRDWIEPGGQRVASYSRLAPGDYQFQVMAAGLDGEWIPAAHSLHFEILPRWWERRSVQGATLAGFILAVAFTAWRVMRNRYRRRLERLQIQQTMARERERIARDIHDDLGSGLTEIMLLGDTLAQEGSATDSTRTMADEISHRSRSLVRAMDEVVWALNPRNDTLESFLTYFNRWAQSYLTRAGLRCRWLVPVDIQELELSAEVRHHLLLASKETINNVVKHAAATQVTIRAELTETKFTMVIEDDGCGMDATIRKRGNGLGNLVSRLQEITGHCKIESTPGRGTRVVFELPIPISPAPWPEKP